jgi:hypothetical protein
MFKTLTLVVLLGFWESGFQTGQILTSLSTEQGTLSSCHQVTQEPGRGRELVGLEQCGKQGIPPSLAQPVAATVCQFLCEISQFLIVGI